MANAFEMVFKAVDKATAPIRKIRKATAGLSSGILKLGKVAAKGFAIGAFAGLTALSGTLLASTSKAIVFESAMADVKKVVDFESPQAFADMGKDILALSREIPLAATSISEIVAAAAQSNVAKGDLLQFAEGAAKVSVAFDMAAGEVGENLAKIKTNLSLNVDETFAFADTLNHLSNNQAALASQLLVFSRATLSMGVNSGFTKNQVAAIGAAMIGTGAGADVAKTSFQNMVRALTKGEAATSSQSEALSRLGLDAKTVAKSMQTDALGTMQLVFEKIRALPKHAQNATISQFFGNEAEAIKPLINNVDVLKKALGDVADTSKFVGKSVEGEFAARAETTANAIQLMKNNMDAIAISVGSRVLPPLNKALQIINDFLAGMGDGNSALEKTLASVQQGYEDFVRGFATSWESIKQNFAGVSEAVNGLGETIASMFGRATGETETYGSTLGKLAGAGFENLLKGIEIYINTIKLAVEALEPAVSATVKFISDLFTSISSNFSGVSEAFSGVMEGFDRLSQAGAKLFDAFGGNDGGLAYVIGSVLTFALEELLKTLQMIIDIITLVIDKLADFVNYVKSINWDNILPDFSNFSVPSFSFFGKKDATAAIDNVEKVKKAVSNDNVETKTKAVVDPKTLAQAAKQAEAVKATQAAIIKQVDVVLVAVNQMVRQADTTLASVDWSHHGGRMMDTIAAGMKARAHVVVDQIRATMQEVRNHLPSSPAKVGPLSDIHKLKFGETIAMSIKADPMVKAMRTATAATRAVANDNAFGILARTELSSTKNNKTKDAIKATAKRDASSSSGNGRASGPSGSGGVVVNYNPTITIKGAGPDAEKNFKEQLEQHSRVIARIIEQEGLRKARRSYS